MTEPLQSLSWMYRAVVMTLIGGLGGAIITMALTPSLSPEQVEVIARTVARDLVDREAPFLEERQRINETLVRLQEDIRGQSDLIRQNQVDIGVLLSRTRPEPTATPGRFGVSDDISAK